MHMETAKKSDKKLVTIRFLVLYVIDLSFHTVMVSAWRNRNNTFKYYPHYYHYTLTGLKNQPPITTKAEILLFLPFRRGLDVFCRFLSFLLLILLWEHLSHPLTYTFPLRGRLRAKSNPVGCDVPGAPFVRVVTFIDTLRTEHLIHHFFEMVPLPPEGKAKISPCKMS